MRRHTFSSMAASTLASFIVVIGVLIAAPGPDWAFTLGVVSRGQSLVAAVSGLVLGYLGLSTAVAVGLGRLVAEEARALAVLTLLGAAYLAWLGVGAIRRPPADFGEDANRRAAGSRSRAAVAAAGVGVSCLNPKALLIFVAVLPQFTTDQSRWPLGAQLAVLGATFAAAVGLFYLLLGVLAVRLLEEHPGLAAHLSRAAGWAMVLLAAALAAQHTL